MPTALKLLTDRVALLRSQATRSKPNQDRHVCVLGVAARLYCLPLIAGRAEETSRCPAEIADDSRANSYETASPSYLRPCSKSSTPVRIQAKRTVCARRTFESCEAPTPDGGPSPRPASEARTAFRTTAARGLGFYGPLYLFSMRVLRPLSL
jgi:hypothetical protein